MTRRLIVVAVALMLLGTACSGSSSTESDAVASDSAGASTSSNGDEGTEPQETNEDPPASDGPSVNEENTSPLIEALGVDLDRIGESVSNYVDDAQQLIRECMAERGFEYTPQNLSVPPSLQRRWELESQLTPEEFRAEYGYGIATLFELNFGEDGVLAFVELLLGPAPDEVRSDAEQEAYLVALHGDIALEGGDATSGAQAQQQAQDLLSQPPGDGSCRQYGFDTAENPEGDIFDGLQSLLGDELEELDDAVFADDRVRDEITDWQRCMAEDGHSYERPDEVPTDVQAQADDIGQRFQSSPEALAIFQKAVANNLAQMNSDERQSFLEREGAFDGLSMSPSIQAEVDDLKEFELVVAARDAECLDDDLMQEVQFEYEQAFVEEHADALALVKRGETE